jgi:hypothetical protein
VTRRKLNLIAALSVIAELEEAVVSHAVMALRFAGFGGAAACRQHIDELEQHGALQITRADNGGDRRQKPVQLTEAGWLDLRHFALELIALTDRSLAAVGPRRLGLADGRAEPRIEPRGPTRGNHD